MATYASDEEQVEALKRWWQENGNSLLIGIAIVLVVFFGSRQWQASQINTAGAASELYQQIADIALLSQGQPQSELDLTSAQAIYSSLKADFPSSIYARYAALIMARFYVERDDLEKGAEELLYILDNPDIGFLKSADEELFTTARLRLARIRIAQGMPQAALDLLGAVEPGPFLASFSEVEGDAYVLLGQTDEARAAYQLALDNNLTGNPVFLQLKLQDLGQSLINQLPTD